MSYDRLKNHTRIPKTKSGVSNYFESSKSSTSTNVYDHHRRKRFTYKRIPVYDSATSDLLSHAPTIVSFISTALCHGSVLVHCQKGVSRSTTAVLFYLMGRTRLTLREGIDLCKRRRPEVEPIPSFVEQLKIYESRCIETGMIRVIDDCARSTKGGDRYTSGKKRKLDDATIGVRGPAKGPSRNIIGPTKNPKKDGNILVIGPSLPPPASADDDGVNDASSLLEQRKARVIYATTGTEKEPLVPPLSHRLKDREEGKSNRGSEEKIVQ